MRRIDLPAFGESGANDAAAFLDCGARTFATVIAPRQAPPGVDALRDAVFAVAAGINGGDGPLVSGIRFAPAWGGDVAVIT